MAAALAALCSACAEPPAEPDGEPVDESELTIKEYEHELLSPEDLARYYAALDANLDRYGLPPDESNLGARVRLADAPATAPLDGAPPSFADVEVAGGMLAYTTLDVTREDIVRAEQVARQKYPEVSQVADVFQVMRTAARKYQVPYELLYLISFKESGFKQFKNWDPARPLTSGDNGFGMTQVTPSVLSERLRNALDMERLEHNPAYNIEIGALIMKSKWDFYTASDRWPVGDPTDPGVFESWYWVICSYNGLSRINNPHSYDSGPRHWVVRGFEFDRVEAYQDAIWRYANLRFGLALTPVDRAEIAPSDQKPEKKVYTLPAPAHALTPPVETEDVGLALSRVTYAAENPDGILEVELTGGGGYVFTGVPADEYYNLMLAEARGTTKDEYFRRAIYGQFPRTEK